MRKRNLLLNHQKAFEYAFTIPAQLSAGDDALGRAAEAIKEAERQLDQSDGLDITELKTRLDNAATALDAGMQVKQLALLMELFAVLRLREQQWTILEGPCDKRKISQAI